MSEQWKPYPFNESILVSSLGRVNYKGKISTGSVSSNGYPQKSVMVNGKRLTKKIHRMVLEAFVGVSELHVNHKNGIKHDNRLENLEYVTMSENQKHSVAMGLLKPLQGSKHGNAKLNEEKVIEIKKRLAKGESQASLGREYGVHEQIIYKIKHGISWKHIAKVRGK